MALSKQKDDLVKSTNNMIPKKKNQKTHFLIVFAIFYILAFFGANSVKSVLINVLFLSIMLFFILLGLGRISRITDKGIDQLDLCKNDLELVGTILLKLNEESQEDIIDELRKKLDVKCNYLQEAFEAYFKERDAAFIGSKIFYQCDVSEYVHEELVEDIGNASFNEFISNALTGLGILGTFVGLIVGLWEFDTTSTEALTNSILPLIEGIKVAFYTSIFGVVLSLLYGTIYRKHMNDAYDALNNFKTIYYKIVGQHPENEAISRLLHYQERQTDSMNQFAEDISIAVADALEAKLSPTLSVLPDQMATAINDAIAPTMVQMGEQFGIVADKLSEAQTTGVEQIVGEFVTQMREIMGNQFNNLNASIQTICEWQGKMIQNLENAINSIIENEKEINIINDELKQAISEIERFTKQIEESQSQNLAKTSELLFAFDNTNTNTERLTNEMAEIFERSGEIMNNISSIAEAMKERFDKILESINNQEAEMERLVVSQISNLNDSSEIIKTQATDMKEVCSGIANGFTESSEKMTEASNKLIHDMDVAMERSYAQFDSQLAKAMEHFSGTLTELRETMENTPKVVDAASQKIQKTTATYLESVNDAQTQYMQKVQEAVLKLEKNTLAMTDSMRIAVNAISK